jgi:hypothetical protein
LARFSAGQTVWALQPRQVPLPSGRPETEHAGHPILAMQTGFRECFRGANESKQDIGRMQL